MDKKYRISDLILDSLKSMLPHLIFYIAGFIGYAFSVGHIMMDEYADEPAKRSSIIFFSGAFIVIYIAVLCLVTKKNIGRKTRLIEASRADDFDSNLYYKETIKRTVLPLFIGGILMLLPYTVFYTRFGYDYLYPSIIDRFYSSSMFFLPMIGGILGSLVHNAVIAGVYALYIGKLQKAELEDRMWIKEAPKQEIVNLNKPKDNYKNY